MDITTSLTTFKLNDKELDALRVAADILQYISTFSNKNAVEVLDKESNDLIDIIDNIYGGASIILRHYKENDED